MRLILILSIFLFSIHAIYAEPAITTHIKNYEVTGKTEGEIRQNLNQHPEQPNGYDAHTRWNVSWNFRWYDAVNTCKITSVQVQLQVDYILPQLSDHVATEAAAKLKWDAYLVALKEHEDGHAQHGIDAAREIELAILNMGLRQNCPILERDANALASQIIAKYAQKDKAFDLQTLHGARTGARFP